MFIHFNTDKGACDDCGNPRTIMHMSVMHADRSVNLCRACFWALAEAMRHASKKINPPQLDTEIIGLSRPPRSAHKSMRTS
jgi:ribosomal protein S14